MSIQESHENNIYSHHSLSGVERNKSERTLLCLLRACQGFRTVVELRNESSCIGVIKNCDGYMNLVMGDAVMTTLLGKKQTFAEIHILGKNIRYVHIPDEIDMLSSIKNELQVLNKSRLNTPKNVGRGRGRFRGRGRGKMQQK